MTNFRKLLAATLICASFLSAAEANVSVNSLFSSGMVLQRNSPIDVWGTASNGEKVTVSIDTQQISTTCSGGKWAVKLKPMSASGPYTLTVAGNNQITVSDVHVGDVWLLCGDENISMPLSLTADASAALNASSDSDLRIYTVPATQQPTTPTLPAKTWIVTDNLNVLSTSAIAYIFGRQLRQQTNTPIGIILCTAEFSTVQSWINPQTTPMPGNIMRSHNSRIDGSATYNAVIAPLVPYSLKGVVWYQANANLSEAYRYRYYLSDLIRGWRSAWGHSDMPFLVVQPCSDDPYASSNILQQSHWAELRDSQTMVTKIAKNTALVNIIDLAEQIEGVPQNKKLIAQRIALIALGKIYKLSVEHAGPQFLKLDIMGNQAVVNFVNTSNGLIGRSGTVQGFAVAGSDRRWYSADAYVVGDRVMVSSTNVSLPVAVRYGWADRPELNLYNRAGFPAYPFRTDTWPLSTQPLKSP